jgi:phosphate-selective porin OprO/OprP
MAAPTSQLRYASPWLEEDVSMKHWKRWAPGLLAASLVVPPLHADDTPAAAPPATETKPPSEPSPQGVKLAASGDGFVIQSESGDFKLQLRALLQFDGRFFFSDDDKVATNNFLIRRARPIFTGTVAKYFEFNLTPDFGGAGNVLATAVPVIQDAFVNVKSNPKLQLRLGKFKPPIGIEHLQQDPCLAMAERAFPASLEPNRDLGVELHGELVKGVVTYAAGVFDGTADGASVDGDLNDSKDLVGRLFFSPFKTGQTPLKGLGFGISGSTGKPPGVVALLAQYRTSGQNGFFSYPSTLVTPAGTRTRVSPELSFYLGPFGLLAEYVRSSGRFQQTDPQQSAELTNEAWQATITVSLTGEAGGYDGVKVKKPFDPGKGAWGAFQLAARVNGFKADSATFDLGYADITKSARKATGVGVGLNWFLNKNVKQVLSYEHTSFEGGASLGDRGAENALTVRAQLSF